MGRLACIVLCVAGLVSHGLAQELGDVGRGRALYGECVNCHRIGPDARNGIGPHLNGIFGRPAGSIKGFGYSRTMYRMGAGGLEWHIDTLDAYIENPRSLVSGTRMNYRGMKDAGNRADLLAFLRAHSDDPADIPEADPTVSEAAHSLDTAILELEGDPEYGAYLSSECTTCHRSDGEDDGIPSITHWPTEEFVIAMHAYRDGIRPHPVMRMVAGRLSNEEIAALAAYFGHLSP